MTTWLYSVLRWWAIVDAMSLVALYLLCLGDRKWPVCENEICDGNLRRAHRHIIKNIIVFS